MPPGTFAVSCLVNVLIVISKINTGGPKTAPSESSNWSKDCHLESKIHQRKRYGLNTESVLLESDSQKNENYDRSYTAKTQIECGIRREIRTVQRYLDDYVAFQP